MSAVDRVVRWSVAAGLAWCVGVALVAPRNSWFVFDRLVVVAACAVGLAGWWLLGRVELPGRVWVGALAGWVLGAAQAVISLAPYGWDAGGVQRRAEVIARGGQLSGEELEYFAWYPNNLFLAAGEIGVMRAGSWVGLAPMTTLFVLNLVLYAVLLWAVGFLMVLLDQPGGVWPAQGAVTVLVGLSPALTVPYSDLPAAAAVALGLVGAGLAWRVTGRRRVGWAVLAGVAVGAAVALKPFVIALPVVVAIMTLARRSGGVLVPVLAGLVAVAVTVPAAGAVGQLGTGLSRAELAEVATPFPAEHFLAMGTYDSAQDSPVRRYGAYHQAQVDATAAIADPEQRRQVLRDTVSEQVGGRSLAQNVRFFALKTAWVWGDGTFWAQGEGPDSTRASYHDGLLGSLAQVTRAPGDHYPIKASVVQGLWLALLTTLVIGLLRAGRCAALTTLALSLGGLTGYLMAFEARPRYLVALLPVIITLTLTGRAATERGGTRRACRSEQESSRGLTRN